MHKRGATVSPINGNFMQLLKTAQGLIQFSFLKTETGRGVKYFILALDKNLKPYWFRMEAIGNKWVVLEKEKVPGWINLIEHDLSDVINLQNFTSTLDDKKINETQ